MPISNHCIYISLLLIIARLQTSKSVCLFVKSLFQYRYSDLCFHFHFIKEIAQVLCSCYVLCQHLHIYILSHPFSLASDGLATSAVIISIDFPADVNSSKKRVVSA